MKIIPRLMRIWRKIKPLLPLFSAIIMLLVASSNESLSRGFYQILRILVCGVSGYFSFKSWKQKYYNWAWALGTIAILFNPIAPIELDKDTWKKIDFFIAIILAGFLLRKKLIIKYIVIISLGIVGILLLGSIFQPETPSFTGSGFSGPRFTAPTFAPRFTGRRF